MARAGSKEIVIVAALLAAAGYALTQRVRSWAEGSGRLTDGRSSPTELDAAPVRHALWEAPAELAPGLAGPGGETRPALSPDGRFLVFASGARGGDANLFVCELRGGLPQAARPLPGVDSGSDELAPAFSDRYLYFASDREGGSGGLDLYRARFADGRCAEPERLDLRLQSAEDDTDPAPARDDGELVFARARGSQSELWRALLGADGRAAEGPSSLGFAGAREPALSADGRVLTFAAPHGTSRALWRALWLRGTWQPPVRIEELDSDADEGGPCPAANGFELTFTRAAAGEAAHLWHARSREVYLLPARPWTWMDSAVVASLVALALMALLARRWPALELLYKCLLLSVLLHLLLLFLMRYVFLDGGEVSPRGSETHRVRFVPTARAEPAAERGPAPARVELASVAALPEALEALVQPPASEPATAPERGELARESPSTPVDARVALATPQEQLHARSLAAPALPLEASSSESSALRAETQSPVASSALEGPTLARPEAEAAPSPERGAAAAPASPTEAHVALAQPREGATKTRAGAAPALPLEASSGQASAQHAAVQGPAASSALEGPALARAPADPGSAPERGSVNAAPSPTDDPRVAVQGPRSERARGAAQPAPALELGSAPGTSAATPEHAAIATPGAAAPGPWKLGAPAPVESATPARSPGVASPAAQGPAPLVALADRESAPAPRRSSSSAPAPDLVSGLEPSAAREAAAPTRPGLERTPEARAAEAPARDSLVRAPESAREEPRVERRSWDHTPYENRAPEQKARALELHGGDEHTEQAVERGLDYLARIQQRGGNWGRLDGFDDKYGQVAVGKTGLCLLAFLGAGHTQASNTKHSAVVARAVEALIALQDPGSGHFGRSDAYSHGIATYALAEDLAMTGDARVRAALEPALRHILAEQNTQSDRRLSGGWSYYFPDGHVFDAWPRTAITAWQVMALESARLSGLEVPDATFEAARRFLENARDLEQGNWRYNHDPGRLNSEYSTLPASTPAAMFALALLGDDLSGADYAPARAYVLERAPGGYRYSGDDDFVARGTGNLYFWYYGTLALFRAGGADWTRWNEAMKRTLLPAQARDGSWEPIDPYARYARDSAGDKSYTSALCVLSLEVYYRYYLPLLRVR